MKKEILKKIIVPAKYDGFRLDIFLAEKIKITRSQAQKLIKKNQLSLNSKLVKKTGQIISAKDVVIIFSEKKKIEKKLITPTKKIKQNKLTEVKIIQDEKDYLVIEKPAKLLTHPSKDLKTESLVSWLLKKYPAIKKVGENPLRPGIVHRLDKDASGLLVIAKNQKMFEHLKKQFKDRTIEKRYYILVHGKVKKDWDEINFPIIRSIGKSGKMAAIPETNKGLMIDKGKIAQTEFFVVKRYANLTLLEVKLHTGRTHQIRAHMLAYNHPVVGDPLYFHKKQKPKWDKLSGRLFLHCFELGFTDLNEKKVTFNSSLPMQLSDFLQQLPQNSSETEKGLMVIISSPSGGGKDAVIKGLLNKLPNAIKFITTTTRDIRPKEVAGVDYYFRTQKEFKEMIKENKFIEYNKYSDQFYGTEKELMEKMLKQYSVIFSNIDINGKKNFDKLGYTNLSIFLMPENFEILKKRIINRGGVDEETLKKRIKQAEKEITQADLYDFIITNYEGKLDETIEQVKQIIKQKLIKVDKN